MALNLNIYSEKEERLYSELFGFLEWDVDEKNIILKNGMSPLRVDNKSLLKYTDYKRIKNCEDFNMFRPLRNFKHCEAILQEVFDGEVVTDITIIKSKDKFRGQYTDFNGNKILTKNTYFSETECKFSLAWLYFFGRECKEEIEEIDRELIETERKLREEGNLPKVIKRKKK